MKKSLIFIFLITLTMTVNAQSSEEANVKATIEAFFEAFHKQDTVALKAMAKGNIKMQSIGTNKEGLTVLNENDYHQFVGSIGSIPKENTFEEKLLDFTIKVDGNMANAWTPYEFWYNGNFSHCGVNSFQLIKESDGWKIIYLVDTRRREGC
ncbi:nuclear transport factor 2 family protein [Winogradskyella aurantiaca]|uniref:nuclear transport factor 2 family protein n=1 Tax=Winogradskyella aurantiaca TaxID=2219558 RepID=UPI000E1D1E17|nr:nuclear transport factor 2 family protein [Winogradskyella aurantiaca]